MINHKVTGLLFAFSVGILLSVYAYRVVTNPEPAQQRAREEAAVMASRAIVADILSAHESLEIVDPLAPDRVVGKTYIYPAADGWDISGHYRRNARDQWHPYLVSLDENLQLRSFSARDAAADLVERAATDPRLTVTR